MATIAMLEAAGHLLEFEPDLEEGEFPSRWVHQAPCFPAWFESLKNETPDAPRNLSPYEQVEQALYDYCMGKPLIYDRDRRRLDPQLFGVWEFKTADVRVFGWLPQKRHFIAHHVAMRRDLKPASKYDQHRNDVVAFRDALDLDHPKFLTGLVPRDIC